MTSDNEYLEICQRKAMIPTAINSDTNKQGLPRYPRRPYHRPPTAKPSTIPLQKPASKFAPTGEQIAADNAAARLRDGLTSGLKMLAAAGAGKSSTLKYISTSAYATMPIYYVVFAKRNAEEAKEKMPQNVESSTLHSVAWRALGLKPEKNKSPSMYRFIFSHLKDISWRFIPEKQACGKNKLRQSVLVARVIQTFCMSDDIVVDDKHVVAVLDEEIGNAISAIRRTAKNLNQNDKKLASAKELTCQIANLDRAYEALRPMLLNAAIKIWPLLKTNLSSYHDVYLKAFELNGEIIRAYFAEYAVVFLDEAQDVNGVQLSILSKSGRPILAVGDSYQQLYAFRGALDSLKLIHGDAVTLSMSFRFGPAIAEVANRILRTHPEGRPRIAVRGTPMISSKVKLLGQHDDIPYEPGNPIATLCRSNNGVLREAIAVASRGMRVHIIGGISESAADIEDALALKECRLSDIKPSSRFARYRDWNEFLIEADGDEELTEIIEALNDGFSDKISRLRIMHDAQPGPQTACIVSTTHKAKGLEWSRVAIGSDFPTISGLQWRYDESVEAEANGSKNVVRQAIEGWHTLYVAATRAMHVLILPWKQREIAS